MSLRVLAVIIFGCCLVSTVSAFCGGCAYCSAEPAGGWGAPAKGEYWGMSFEDIKNSPDTSDTTSESDYWNPPTVILPSSNAGKFASLNEYRSKFGDSQSLPGKNSNIQNPDFSTKPGIDVKSIFI
jgi:hypothetical protein